jgi:hypothetical protein
MRLVYATNTPRHFEFAVAARPDALPSGAQILAVCDGQQFEGRLDGSAFDRMTDEEYYTLQTMIARARRDERRRSFLHARRALAPFRTAFRRLLGIAS